MVDIFALPIAWADDAREATYKDFDGSEVAYTIDRVIRQVNNVMSGHHPGCGMDDCKSVDYHGTEIGTCMILGPTTPEAQAEAPPSPRKVGFDIDRNASPQDS